MITTCDEPPVLRLMDGADGRTLTFATKASAELYAAKLGSLSHARFEPVPMDALGVSLPPKDPRA